MGETFFTLNQLIYEKKKCFTFQNKGNYIGFLNFEIPEIITRRTFIDYIQLGTR